MAPCSSAAPRRTRPPSPRKTGTWVPFGLVRTLLGVPDVETITVDANPHPEDHPQRALALVLICNASRPADDKFAIPLGRVRTLLIDRGPHGKVERLANEPGGWRLTLDDPLMSQSHARICRRDGTWQLRDQGSKNGVFVWGRRIFAHLLEEGDLLELGATFLLFTRQTAVDLSTPPDPLPPYRGPAYGMETFLAGLRDDYERFASVATSDVRVLVHGESGTGKELVARAYHMLSGRAGAFVGVNCGAIPTTLIESELFGYRKGAFSGAAADRLGLIREADGGTLFLDEIGDLPPPAQTTLLRVLQEERLRPVGGSRELEIDVRVCCASHRDLAALVAQGQFRADLYGRLAGLRFDLPALRDRAPDMGLILGRLLEGLSQANRSICRGAVRRLMAYRWPLNIRELGQALAVACATEPERLHLRSLEYQPPPQSERDGEATPLVELAADDERRREQLANLLLLCSGNISEVSRRTGRARALIRRWLRRYGLDAGAYRAHP
jgi:hypothetical protein